MLSSNKIWPVLITAIGLLSACTEHKVLFSFDRNVNASFLREMPGIGPVKYLGSTVTKKAVNIEVYKSSFRERYFEKNNLLEYTELNEDSKIPSVDYLDIVRYSQDLYMLKYHFEWLDTSTGSGKIVPEDAAIFLAVKKNKDDSVLGVMPCYWGLINPDFNFIAFDQPATFREKKSEPYLKLNKKDIRRPGLLFMPANFPVITQPETVEENESKQFKIEKIVRLDPNKIGGDKPLVFNIKEIFKDENALQFHYVNTLSINK